jgi:LmbE family N-acetylglucosaminyl deacetylase
MPALHRFRAPWGVGIAIMMGASSFAIRAQSPMIDPPPDALAISVDRGAPGLYTSLRKLRTRASLLMVTAHPDDEDGGMLAFESRGQGARVMLLTLSRGESGANVMSPDFFDALGLVRTEELLAAGRYYGVEQYFGRAVNNGFSKTKEETLAAWSHDRVLEDTVRVVRMTRPLVITSVFIGGPTDGHGNHQVAGQMAQEVFRAAADPKMFPEQIRAGLRPWQPLKVYERVPSARVTAQGVYDYATHHYAPARVYDYINNQWLPWGLSADVSVPEGEIDPLVGLSYLQIAREGLGFQRSQNGGVGEPPAGAMAASYHRFASIPAPAAKENSVFDGIDIGVIGIASLAPRSDPALLREGLARISDPLEAAIRDFRADQPDRIAPALAAGLKETTSLIAQVTASSMPESEKYDVLHELGVKQRQFNTALQQALGITIEAAVSPESGGGRGGFGAQPDTFRLAIPGQQFNVRVHINNGSSAPLELRAMRLATPGGEQWEVTPQADAAGSLAPNQPKNAMFRVTVPADAKATRPYFSRPNVEQGWYGINDERYTNLPMSPYPAAAWATVQYQGVDIAVGQVVQTAQHVNGQGTVMEPLVVAPAISVSTEPSAGIVALGAASFPLVASVRSNVKGPARGTVKLQLPAGWRSEPASAAFSTAQDGDQQRLPFRIFPSQVRQESYAITAVAEYAGRQYREGFHVTGYARLRPDYLYRPATYRAAGVDVKVAPGLNVGYVMGSGDEVPQSLENLGIHVKLLAPADLASGDLRIYDEIILGVRTYAVRDDLRANNARLLDYVRDGGVVMVEYNTPEFDHNFGPYPYGMTNDPEEVTDEESAINILDPANPVFAWPNKIAAKDFLGWVSERGSKFMSTWDAHYEALLETHDPGQDPQKGGLLYAPYGKGIYIYNAYAFYRQLPEGVPGAYRIMANLVSLPKNPARKTTGVK